MTKFSGTADKLKHIIEAQNLRGTWEDFPQGLRYRTPDKATISWYSSTKTILLQGNQAAKDKLSALIQILESHEATPASTTPNRGILTADTPIKKIFLVHGHDHASLEQLELVIRKLGIQPFVLANTSGKGLTIMEALEAEIGTKGSSACGIVLLTPDDMGYAKVDGAESIQPRARQNVILEMGMLMAAVGRPNTIILKKGKLELPSDAGNQLYIPFQNHVKETVPKLVSRLKDAGFSIEAQHIIDAAS
ncbi:nucleotide-binding protein [Hymenobacter convexus]|uniref:nucleotide-binding protein n=1 Tax=Hymenobacter sp. CA1UV-4 TaxID=3063782 RepID=UPI0027124D51|nr:nucleotide-binding protein [Hymenobacter sp. CA1UV-4]MDO7852278.1 nucleotide-binding protein [Hymenobacter sp. CA1UV-4]